MEPADLSLGTSINRLTLHLLAVSGLLLSLQCSVPCLQKAVQCICIGKLCPWGLSALKRFFSCIPLEIKPQLAAVCAMCWVFSHDFCCRSIGAALLLLETSLQLVGLDLSKNQISFYSWWTRNFPMLAVFVCIQAVVLLIGRGMGRRKGGETQSENKCRFCSQPCHLFLCLSQQLGGVILILSL